MAANPLITFKAGRCTFSGKKVTPDPQPGYIYIYTEDELPHFCWRPRDVPGTEPALDLTMVPGDGNFEPWLKEYGAEELHSPTNGRVYTLRFESSSQKYFFYLQSKSQHRNGDPSWWSDRDQRVGQVVNAILQGEEVDVEGEVAEIRNQRNGGDGGAGGDDDEMELDEQEPRPRHGSTGGAGADATGGDPREEGEASREGGADGGRADAGEGSQDPSALVQNFLRSIQGGQPGRSQQQSQPMDKAFTTLPDLLSSSSTIPFLHTASPAKIDALCSFLPPDLFVLAQESTSTPTLDAPEEGAGHSAADAEAALATLSQEQKKEVLARVLHSPQLQQSLGSLTVALRDGGLPMIGDALGLKVENGGLIRGGSMPVGGSDAVKVFVEGVKRTAEQEGKRGQADDKDKMEE